LFVSGDLCFQLRAFSGDKFGHVGVVREFGKSGEFLFEAGGVVQDGDNGRNLRMFLGVTAQQVGIGGGRRIGKQGVQFFVALAQGGEFFADGRMHSGVLVGFGFEGIGDDGQPVFVIRRDGMDEFAGVV
jgi:hypothetical protein